MHPATSRRLNPKPAGVWKAAKHTFPSWQPKGIPERLILTFPNAAKGSSLRRGAITGDMRTGKMQLRTEKPRLKGCGNPSRFKPIHKKYPGALKASGYLSFYGGVQFAFFAVMLRITKSVITVSAVPMRMLTSAFWMKPAKM